MVFLVVGLLLSQTAPDAGSSRPLRIRAVGDVMLGTSVPQGYLPPDGGANLLDGVAALLRDADLTFANMEGPLCDSGASTKCRKGGSCFAFRTPTSYGRFLEEVGVDLASTANNHSGDFGESCRRETEGTLDAHHITWSGPPGSIGRRTIDGRRIALVAFHTSASCNDVNDLSRARELVKQAAGDSDVVIVSFHGGAEGARASRVPRGPEKYLGERRGDVRAFAHAVVEAGADLVLGHGPHVLRGMEVYRERLIAYSLGNFATYGRFDLRGALGVAGILEVQLDESGRFTAGRVFPTRQTGEGIPEVDPRGRALELLRELSRLDFGATSVHLDEGGALHAPERR
jgi:hypothetical protein